MADDTRISNALPKHHKTLKLGRRLGKEGCWSLVCLFLWTSDNRCDGNLHDMSNEDIAIVADWDGEPDNFVSTLAEVGFLDGMKGNYKVHDWAENNPYAANRPNRIARGHKAAIARWQKPDAVSTPTACPSNAASMPTECESHNAVATSHDTSSKNEATTDLTHPGDFDGHVECLKFYQAYPGTDSANLVQVADKIAQAWLRAVELEAMNFNGDLSKAAGYILDRTNIYAASPERAKFTHAVVRYLDEGVYRQKIEGEPAASAKKAATANDWTTEKQLALMDAGDRKRAELRAKAANKPPFTVAEQLAIIEYADHRRKDHGGKHHPGCATCAEMGQGYPLSSEATLGRERTKAEVVDSEK